MHTDAFKDAEISEVVDILTWNGVCEKNEELIFNAAIRWLEFKPENRRQFEERFDCLLLLCTYFSRSKFVSRATNPIFSRKRDRKIVKIGE